MSYQTPPPETFNFKPEEWSRWIKRFKRFRKATELDQRTAKGEEADDIVMPFELTAEEAKQYNVVKGKFEAHFVVKRKVIFERANKMVSQWIISYKICIVLLLSN